MSLAAGWQVPFTMCVLAYCLNSGRRPPFVHAGCLSHLLHHLRVRMGCCCAPTRMFLQVNQLSWVPLLFRAVSCEILPNSSLNKPSSSLLKAKVVVLLFILLLTRLKASQSQSWQPGSRQLSQPRLVHPSDRSITKLKSQAPLRSSALPPSDLCWTVGF